jgi:hypothetical protein
VAANEFSGGTQVIKRSALSMVGVMALGVSLALAPMVPASAANHKQHTTKSHHKKKKHPSKVTVTTVKSANGSNPGSSFCVEYKNEEAVAEKSKYASTMTSDLESGNLAGVKAAFKEIEATDGPLLAKAKALIDQTPANVQAAFKIVIAQLPKEYADVSSATSISQLESSFETFESSPEFKNATETVANYVTGQCGSVTPTT